MTSTRGLFADKGFSAGLTTCPGAGTIDGGRAGIGDARAVSKERGVRPISAGGCCEGKSSGIGTLELDRDRAPLATPCGVGARTCGVLGCFGSLSFGTRFLRGLSTFSAPLSALDPAPLRPLGVATGVPSADSA